GHAAAAAVPRVVGEVRAHAAAVRLAHRADAHAAVAGGPRAAHPAAGAAVAVVVGGIDAAAVARDGRSHADDLAGAGDAAETLGADHAAGAAVGAVVLDVGALPVAHLGEILGAEAGAQDTDLGEPAHVIAGAAVVVRGHQVHAQAVAVGETEDA